MSHTWSNLFTTPPSQMIGSPGTHMSCFRGSVNSEAHVYKPQRKEHQRHLEKGHRSEPIVPYSIVPWKRHVPQYQRQRRPPFRHLCPPPAPRRAPQRTVSVAPAAFVKRPERRMDRVFSVAAFLVCSAVTARSPPAAGRSPVLGDAGWMVRMVRSGLAGARISF